MKKIIFIMLISALLLLSACGGSASPNDSKTVDLTIGDTVLFGYYGDDSGLDLIGYKLADRMGETISWYYPIEWEIVGYNAENNLFTLLSTKGLWEESFEKVSWQGLEGVLLRNDTMKFFFEKAFLVEKDYMGYLPINTASESHEYSVWIPYIEDIREWFGTTGERVCYNMEGNPCNYYVLDRSVVLKSGEIESFEYTDTVTAYVRPVVCVDKTYLDQYTKELMEAGLYN